MANNFNSFRPISKLFDTQGWHGVVDYVSELPNPIEHPNELYLVYFNDESGFAGWYVSKNDEWNHLYDESRASQEDFEQEIADRIAEDIRVSNESIARDTTLQNNIDEEAITREEQDTLHLALAKEYTDTTIDYTIANLNQVLVEGDVKTVKYTNTASEGQTTIRVPFSGFTGVEVYINGIHQNSILNAYTFQADTFTFSESLNEGDEVFFLLGIGYEITDYTNFDYELFTATAGQVEYTLAAPLLSGDILVYINGVKQASNAYSVNANIISFTEELFEGDLVEINKLNRIQAATEYHEAIALFKTNIVSNTVIQADYNAVSCSPIITEGTTVTVTEGAEWHIY